MKKQTQLKSPAKTTTNGILKSLRSRVAKQAALAIFTVVVTVILLFAMTTAWYTNVVETGGLTFQAEAWGFEGEITLQEEVIKAAPGDSGVVYMSISNDSDSISQVTVNVSKDFMNPKQMQQRIFFYIDEQMTANNEVMNRRYLSNTNGYTYTLFGHNSLLISEKVHTHPQLKWLWVYDVVGYYFRGTVTEKEYIVDEYLRPVEYSYDDATYDEDGNLLTVDGTKDVGTFISEITAVDCFYGKYSYNEEGIFVDRHGAEVKPLHGCYHIAQIDGQDIWLRLCTKQEIEANTRWDTDFGAAAVKDEEGKFLARISVSGQQVSQNAVMVNSPEKLTSALSAANGGIVRLDSSLVLNSAVNMYSRSNALLDLNGHTITYTGDGVAFNVGQNAELTVINGTIQGDRDDPKGSAFYTIGGQLTLSNVVVDKVYRAITIDDQLSAQTSGANSSVRIVDSDITAKEVTVKISGDGTMSEELTYLVIQDSKITSNGYIGIVGNGNENNPGNWGTDIQILNSEVSGYYAGVYHPQQHSSMLIDHSKIEGITGLAIKGGNVEIVDSVVMGIGEGKQITIPTEENLSLSGFVDSGDGIYVEANYKKAINLKISGSETKVSSVGDETRAIRVFPEVNYVTVKVTGGTFSSYVAQFLPAGYYCQLQNDTTYVVTKS